MDVLKFHQAMKNHCLAENANCEKCCMRLFCYTPPCEKTDSMMETVMAFLSSPQSCTGSDSHSARHSAADQMPCPCNMDMSSALGYEPH